MVKPRSQQTLITKKKTVDSATADSLADKLADKPYGISENKNIDNATENNKSEPTKDMEIERITISIPRWMSYELEDVARHRKRSKQENRTVSAIVREALDKYFDKNNTS